MVIPLKKIRVVLQQSEAFFLHARSMESISNLDSFLVLYRHFCFVYNPELFIFLFLLLLTHFLSSSSSTTCLFLPPRYWRKPHSLPMFKDLVGASACRGANAKSEYLSKLKAEMDHDPDGTLEPTG